MISRRNFLKSIMVSICGIFTFFKSGFGKTKRSELSNREAMFYKETII